MDSATRVFPGRHRFCFCGGGERLDAYRDRTWHDLTPMQLIHALATPSRRKACEPQTAAKHMQANQNANQPMLTIPCRHTCANETIPKNKVRQTHAGLGPVQAKQNTGDCSCLGPNRCRPWPARNQSKPPSLNRWDYALSDETSTEPLFSELAYDSPCGRVPKTQLVNWFWRRWPGFSRNYKAS